MFTNEYICVSIYIYIYLFIYIDLSYWGRARQGGAHRARGEAAVHTGLFFTEMCIGSEVGSYLRRIDLCITQL